MYTTGLTHPDIIKAEKFGVPMQEEIYCPMCGCECEKFYKHGKEIIGCDYCIDEVDAWEEMENEK